MKNKKLIETKKEGLIKLTGEDNLFYDSIERVYRWRMHCPRCGTYSGCRCFPDLEEAELAAEEGMEYCCSSLCALIVNADEDGDFKEQVEEALRELGIHRTTDELNYEETKRIIREINNRELKTEKKMKPQQQLDLSQNVAAIYEQDSKAISEAKEHLKLRMPTSMLMHENLLKILEFMERERETIDNPISNLMEELGINRKLEDLTEDEAKQILDKVGLDCDFPNGEAC